MIVLRISGNVFLRGIAMGIFDKIFGKKGNHEAENMMDNTGMRSPGDKHMIKQSSHEKDVLKQKQEEEKRIAKGKKEAEKVKLKQINNFRKSIRRFYMLKMNSGSIITCYINHRKKGKNFSPKGIAQKFNIMYNILFENVYDSNGNVVGVDDPHYREIIIKLRYPYVKILHFIQDLRTKNIEELDKIVTSKNYIESIHDAEHTIGEGARFIYHAMRH